MVGKREANHLPRFENRLLGPDDLIELSYGPAHLVDSNPGVSYVSQQESWQVNKKQKCQR